MKQVKSIMLIDDDMVSNLVCEKVLKNENLVTNVVTFITVNEALDYIKNEKILKNLPEVILLDINFPNENGWYFLEHYQDLVKDIDKQPTLYILTSSVSNWDMQHAEESPLVKGFISKPMDGKKIRDIFSHLS